MPEQEIDERQARSIALEKAYVHDVYDYIAPHFSNRKYHVWPRIKQFLYDLEPGSLVADVGCGQGNYLGINNEIFKIGTDRCEPLLEVAAEKRHEVVHCDNLQLPFRDESLDAALSVAVVHHFATTERRVEAIRELARILRIGGRVMITVWAMEQRHRRFESQDVLVPWHQPAKSSSEDRGSSVEREVNSTTSDDDMLVYQAYSHMSDSDGTQKRQKFRRGRSFDTSSPSSSELSSPNETCYSFVRRALKKLSSSTSPYSYSSRSRPYFYSSCRRPWFSDNNNSEQKERKESADSESAAEDQPIELRHLDKNEITNPSVTSPEKEENLGHKSRSFGNILGLIPNLLRSKSGRTVDKKMLQEIHKRISTVSDPREYVRKSMGLKNGIVRSKSTVSCITRLTEIQCVEEDEDEMEKIIKSKITKGEKPVCAKRNVDTKNEQEQIIEKVLEVQVVNAGEDTSHIASSYYSMPELHQLPIVHPEQQQSTLTLPIAECYEDLRKESYGPMEFCFKDDMVVPLRNGFVKRSVSVDTGDNKGVRGELRPRRFSASATQGLLGTLRTCIIPKSPSRGSSLKSDTSVDSEESIISVIPGKSSSIQSDTSVDSEDSIVSVIHQSSLELDTFTWDLRKEALTRSAQTSPLTVNLDKLSSSPSKDEEQIESYVNTTENFAEPRLDYFFEAPLELLPKTSSTTPTDSSAKNDTFLNLKPDFDTVLPKDIFDVKEETVNHNVPMYLYTNDELIHEDPDKIPVYKSRDIAGMTESNDQGIISKRVDDTHASSEVNISGELNCPNISASSPCEEKPENCWTTCALSDLTDITAFETTVADGDCTATVYFENKTNEDTFCIRPVAHSFDSERRNSLPFEDDRERVTEDGNVCEMERTVLPEENFQEEEDEINAKSHNTSLSTSLESLNDNETGGSVTFHRYYHVFREGELDSLIEKYVENLHIISSYYDHANWCVIAEKVQVWTI